MRIEKDSRALEERSLTSSDRIEKNMTHAFNRFRNECEMMVTKSEANLEQQVNSVKNRMEYIDSKIDRIEETSVVKNWTNNLLIDAETRINKKIKLCNEKIDLDLEVVKDTNKTVSKSLDDFCKRNEKAISDL
jgi:hypothetical protein